MMKILAITLVLSLYSSFSFSGTRAENIDFLYTKSGTPEVIDESINAYRQELFRQYPEIYERIPESVLLDAFSVGRESLKNSYIRGYNIYTDKEIEELFVFYQTDKGKWMLEKSMEYSKVVQSNFNLGYEEINDAYIKLVSEYRVIP